MDVIDNEKVLLGTLINYAESYYEHADSVNESCFLDARHKSILKCIQSRALEGDLDVVTLTEQAKKQKLTEQCGGVPYIAEVSSTVGNPGVIKSYIDICKKTGSRDKIFQLHNKISNALKDHKDPDDIFGDIAEFSDSYDLTSTNEISVNKAADDFIENLDKPMSTNFIKTGFNKLDEKIGGFERSDLIIVAGVTSMGKTSFVLNIANNMLLQNKGVAVFSLEMNSSQLMTRMIASEAHVELRKIRYKDFNNKEKNDLIDSANKLKTTNLIIDDKSSTLGSIASKIRKIKLKNKIDVVIVDYLQLVKYNKNGASREQEVAKVVRSLKNIAKQNDIVVLALSQLSRKVDNREGSKIPTLGDLRESGEIEQAADSVVFIYRPDYYEIEKSTEMVQTAEIIVAKGRNSGLCTSECLFVPSITKFCETFIP